MELDLDALERIAQAATPGPWRHVETAWGESVEVDEQQLFIESYGVTYAWNGDNAAHIAAFDPPTALALIARVRELEAIVNDGGNQAAKYWTRLTAAEREMHARELHHFEAEQAMREALELIQPGIWGNVGSTRDVAQARAILSRALNDKEAEK